MFLSENYATKLWTNHEMKSAQTRAFEERGNEYLLPVKIDNTEIPGVRSTTGYLDARNMNPSELANTIAEKLGRHTDFKELMTKLNDYLGIEDSKDGYNVKQEGGYLHFDLPSEEFQTSYSTKMLIEAMKSKRLDNIIQDLL